MEEDEYAKPVLFGKNEDGLYLGRIEQIEGGHKEIKLPFGIIIKETPDILDISNRKPSLWFGNVFSGYRQIGQYKIKRPHNYEEGQDIIVRISQNKIVEIWDETK